MANKPNSSYPAIQNPPPRLILQHGMKRSGNHAITNWILPKISCEYINNFIPVGPILSGAKPYPEPVSFQIWKEQRDAELQSFYVSLEDHSLDVEPFSNVDIKIQNILIVRHPDNVFASRIKKAFKTEMDAYPRGNDTIMKRAVGLWKQHALCYLDRGTYLNGRVAILFDEWFENQAYRAEICSKLNIPMDNDELPLMSKHGGGSSFDGMMFFDRPGEMSVLDRVSGLNVEERGLLNALYDDDELSDLKSAIENACPFDLLQPS